MLGTPDVPLDFSYDSRYLPMHRYLCLALLVFGLTPHMEIPTAVAAVFYLWLQLAYIQVSSSIRFVPPLKLGGATAVCVAALLQAAAEHDVGRGQLMQCLSNNIHYVALTIGGLAMLIAVLRWWQERQERRQELLESEIPTALRQLAAVRGRVRVTDALSLVQGSEPPPVVPRAASPHEVAQLLVQYERAVLAERLGLSFLQRRARWLVEVAESSITYSKVAHLAQELGDAIAMPHGATGIMAVLRAWRPGGRADPLPPVLRHIIVNHIFDYTTVESCLPPLTILVAKRNRVTSTESQFSTFLADVRRWYPNGDLDAIDAAVTQHLSDFHGHLDASARRWYVNGRTLTADHAT